MSPAPKVSVCVSTRDRAGLLPRLFDALGRQTLQEFELVIVDDGSRDSTPAVLTELADRAGFPTRVLRNGDSQGQAAGRNRAWRAATAAVIAFTDDDCLPAPDWLACGLRTVSRESHVVAAGSVRVHPEQVARFGPFSYAPLVDSSNAFWFATANAFYRRDDLQAAGGFDETLPRAAEDTELAWRVITAGARPVFAEDAVVYHDVREFGAWRSIRQQQSWADVAAIFKSTPAARTRLLYLGVFWKRQHAHALLMLAGLLAARSGAPWRGLALAGPWLHDRLCAHPRAIDLPDRWATLPGVLLMDLAEIAAMVRGSWRHRAPVL
jgi:hypothetical protein